MSFIPLKSSTSSAFCTLPSSISGKIRGSSYGYYIIKYVGDSVEGPIALDEVKETISSSLLSTKQTETYNNTLQSWVDAADFKVDLNALNN